MEDDEVRSKTAAVIRDLPDDCDITVQVKSITYINALDAVILPPNEFCEDVIHIDANILKSLLK